MTPSKPLGRPETVAIVCLAFVVVAAVMVAVGDPIWNLYVVSLGLFVALPVGLIAVSIVVRSRLRRK